LFDAFSAQSCSPLTPDDQCIPFLYPDDGCEARAADMCRSMKIDHGIVAGKVWLYAEPAKFEYFVKTPNSPVCRVPWGYHVAPVVRTDSNDLRVIDPSLFTAPVVVEQWKNRQFADGTIVLTSAAVYDQPKAGKLQFDPQFVKMRQVLAKWRLALRLRSVKDGPPPYKC
jgi:hypothetical protein